MLAQISEFAVNHPYLVIAFVVLLALTFFNEMKIATQRFASLTPAAAVQLMNNEDVVVVDVREPSETVGGKIAKAIQIPVGALANIRIDGFGETHRRAGKTQEQNPAGLLQNRRAFRHGLQGARQTGF